MLLILEQESSHLGSKDSCFKVFGPKDHITCGCCSILSLRDTMGTRILKTGPWTWILRAPGYFCGLFIGGFLIFGHSSHVQPSWSRSNMGYSRNARLLSGILFLLFEFLGSYCATLKPKTYILFPHGLLNSVEYGR